MKKSIVLVLMVLLMAVPAMATVNFTAVDAGSGQLKISYASDAGELPRGIALKITLTGSNGKITGTADVVSKDAAYNTNIDYAYSNPVGYVVGLGHPLANPLAAGVVTFPASTFSVCMGVLDETGNQLPGPGSSANLITIQLHGDSGGSVCAVVDVDSTRGGVVGSQLTTNLPLGSVCVAIPVAQECMMATHPAYTNWSTYAGKADCWCYQKQCRADADGMNGPGAGPFPVSQDDLVILAAQINKLTPPGFCADFDHKKGPGAGPFPVSQDDLTILAGWINKLPGPTVCDGTYINFWIIPAGYP